MMNELADGLRDAWTGVLELFDIVFAIFHGFGELLQAIGSILRLIGRLAGA